MRFLKDTDFKGIIALTILNRLRGVNDEDLNESEKLAVSELASLRGRYDIDAELGKSGDNRNEEMKRMVVNITAYYLYNTVIDDEIPERIADNFKKESRAIQNIAQGKTFCTLKPLKLTDGTIKSKFRSGSDKGRDNNIF